MEAVTGLIWVEAMQMMYEAEFNQAQACCTSPVCKYNLCVVGL